MSNPSILRLLWHPITVPGCSGKSWAALMRYKPARFMWLRNPDYIVVAIRPDSQVALFDIPELNESTLSCMDPFCTINDRGMKNMPSLSETFFWPDIEGLYSRYHSRDLLSGYATLKHIPTLRDRVNRKGLPGWHIVSRGDRSLTVVKDFMDNDGAIVAVGVSSGGVAIYRTSLQEGCRLRVDERRHMVGSACLSADVMTAFLPWPAAQEVCSVFRMIRWWLYLLIVEDEALPF